SDWYPNRKYENERINILLQRHADLGEEQLAHLDALVTVALAQVAVQQVPHIAHVLLVDRLVQPKLVLDAGYRFGRRLRTGAHAYRIARRVATEPEGRHRHEEERQNARE